MSAGLRSKNRPLERRPAPRRADRFARSTDPGFKPLRLSPPDLTTPNPSLRASSLRGASLRASSPRHSNPRHSSRTTNVTPLRSPSRQQSVVRSLPVAPSLPHWLQVLQRFQRLSLALTLLLASGATLTYGLTIYSQHQWGENFKHLEGLRSQERQLASNTAKTTAAILQQENPADYGLVPRSQNHLIMVAPAPLRQPAKPNLDSDRDAQPMIPRGY
jgi:hypothetical protein